MWIQICIRSTPGVCLFGQVPPNIAKLSSLAGHFDDVELGDGWGESEESSSDSSGRLFKKSNTFLIFLIYKKRFYDCFTKVKFQFFNTLARNVLFVCQNSYIS